MKAILRIKDGFQPETVEVFRSRSKNVTRKQYDFLSSVLPDVEVINKYCFRSGEYIYSLVF